MFLRKIKSLIAAVSRIASVSRLYDLMVYSEFEKRRKSHINPLNRCSRLIGWSQFDEDSITLEIIQRMSIDTGAFLEFGVGDGLENNSIVLLAKGWRGFWFGGEDLAVNLSKSEQLKFRKVWITKSNVVELAKSADHDPDVISLDLDGNDLYLVEELLRAGILPKLFIVEYNAKIPYGVSFSIEYREDHVFKSNDYFGASLTSFVRLFDEFGFKLVCCSLSGANAFFVHPDCTHLFADVPSLKSELYNEPFYFPLSRKMHPTSVNTVQKLIS